MTRSRYSAPFERRDAKEGQASFTDPISDRLGQCSLCIGQEIC